MKAADSYGGRRADTSPGVNIININLNLKEKENQFIARSGRVLGGKRYETFMAFWKAFALPIGKTEAADAWLDIPTLNMRLVHHIVAAAKAEAERRPQLEKAGRYYKYAKGWLNDRRWEDFEPPAQTKPKPEPEALTPEQWDRAKETREKVFASLRAKGLMSKLPEDAQESRQEPNPAHEPEKTIAARNTPHAARKRPPARYGRKLPRVTRLAQHDNSNDIKIKAAADERGTEVPEGLRAQADKACEACAGLEKGQEAQPGKGPDIRSPEPCSGKPAGKEGKRNRDGLIERANSVLAQGDEAQAAGERGVGDAAAKAGAADAAGAAGEARASEAVAGTAKAAQGEWVARPDAKSPCEEIHIGLAAKGQQGKACAKPDVKSPYGEISASERYSGIAARVRNSHQDAPAYANGKAPAWGVWAKSPCGEIARTLQQKKAKTTSMKGIVHGNEAGGQARGTAVGWPAKSPCGEKAAGRQPAAASGNVLKLGEDLARRQSPCGEISRTNVAGHACSWRWVWAKSPCGEIARTSAQLPVSLARQLAMLPAPTRVAHQPPSQSAVMPASPERREHSRLHGAREPLIERSNNEFARKFRVAIQSGPQGLRCLKDSSPHGEMPKTRMTCRAWSWRWLPAKSPCGEIHVGLAAKGQQGNASAKPDARTPCGEIAAIVLYPNGPCSRSVNAKASRSPHVDSASQLDGKIPKAKAAILQGARTTAALLLSARLPTKSPCGEIHNGLAAKGLRGNACARPDARSPCGEIATMKAASLASPGTGATPARANAQACMTRSPCLTISVGQLPKSPHGEIARQERHDKPATRSPCGEICPRPDQNPDRSPVWDPTIDPACNPACPPVPPGRRPCV